MSRLCLAIVMAASALVAQPKFDVVSIRPTRSPIRLAGSPYLPGGHFNDPGTILLFLIPMAYDIPLPDRQLLGLPEWAKRTAYSVEAKAAADFPTLAPAENEAQIKFMLREMLADRFKFRIHMETREEDTLIMTIGNGGFKVKEVSAPVPPEKAGDVSAALGDRGGRLSGKKATIARLATVLSLFLKQDVIDQTNLTGYYDFEIRWDALRREGAPPPAATLGPDGIVLFLSTLREELGLRFTRGKGTVQYWVIDSVEPPTEN
jgi:uncharacterized protein (TIGR03435 family)